MKKVLVIEDEQDIRVDLLTMLKYEGFEAIGAEHGRIGIELAHTHLPDLILCDIMMPELDGYHVLAELRGHPATAAIPFIFLTARATREDVRKGMRLGADDYLAKPFTITELVAAIQARLDRQAGMSKQMEDLRVSLGLILPNEIRNALTGILEFSEFLRTPEMLPGIEEIAAIGTVIHENGLALQRLVENYMLYAELKLLEARPEKTSAWLEQEPVDTEHVIAFFSRYAARRAKRVSDLVLHLTTAGLLFSIKSLQKIVIEVVDNAFKFSAPGTPVQVMSAVLAQDFILKIIDQGRGMDEEQLARLGSFVKVEDDWPVQQGPGMGLILARLLVELHGGVLQISSSPNQGTTVTVTLRNLETITRSVL